MRAVSSEKQDLKYYRYYANYTLESDTHYSGGCGQSLLRNKT